MPPGLCACRPWVALDLPGTAPPDRQRLASESPASPTVPRTAGGVRDRPLGERTSPGHRGGPRPRALPLVRHRGARSRLLARGTSWSHPPPHRKAHPWPNCPKLTPPKPGRVQADPLHLPERGRLSADADGLIDTAELLRAGFTLQRGQTIGRPELTHLDTIDVHSRHAGRLPGHDHPAASSSSADAQAREQAALSGNGPPATVKRSCSRCSTTCSTAMTASSTYPAARPSPRPPPGCPRSHTAPCPSSTRRPAPPRRRQLTPGAPCVGASSPCSRTIRRG